MKNYLSGGVWTKVASSPFCLLLELLSRASMESNDDETNENKTKNPNLLTPNWAAVLLCGEMIGAGSLSLPTALQYIGFYSGILLYIFIMLTSATFAYMLSKTYATFRTPLRLSLNYKHMRDPYPQIAGYTIGRTVKLLVIISILVSDFLGTAALILLPADIIVRSFEIYIIKSLSARENTRIWVAIFTSIVIPFTWNDRPRDNKIVAFLSLGSGILGNLLIIVLYILSSDVVRSLTPSNNPSDVRGYILGIGIFLGTTDGFDVLPNIQEDMRDCQKYKAVIFRAYILFSLITLPVMLGGYLLFHQHHHLSENILIELLKVGLSQEQGPRYQIYNVIAKLTLALFTLHVLMTTVLQLNPSFQYMETHFPCRDGTYYMGTLGLMGRMCGMEQTCC